MRDIKFRCWTGTMMEEWDHIQTWESLGSHLSGNTEFEWMQFTGLIDKNKKEIYEGDILKCYHNDYYGDGENHFMYIVSFQDGDFWGINPDCCLPKHCEIIGNIYQDKNKF